MGSPKSFYKDILFRYMCYFCERVGGVGNLVGSDKKGGAASSKLNTKFGDGASVRGRSVGHRLYTYPGFSCWCPCLAKRKCE